MMSQTRHAALRHVLVPEARHVALGGRAPLDGDKLKHLRKVLRMEWGEALLVIDGSGRLLDATLEKAGESGFVSISAVRRTQPEPLGLELVVAMPKNATMDWVVEKAVECGATRVTAVVSSRSVVKPGGDDTGKYVRRWQAIMDDAVEQSEQLWRPLITGPMPWHEFLAQSRDMAEGPSFVFFSELRELAESEDELLKRCLAALRSSHGRSMRIMIGPEGGFSQAERSELTSSGFVPLSLGTAVLRVETAVVAALTLARVIRMVPVS